VTAFDKLVQALVAKGIPASQAKKMARAAVAPAKKKPAKASTKAEINYAYRWGFQDAKAGRGEDVDDFAADQVAAYRAGRGAFLAGRPFRSPHKLKPIKDPAKGKPGVGK
jgi:hypothetical protein